MKKILLILCLSFFALGLFSCKNNPTPTPTPTPVPGPITPPEPDPEPKPEPVEIGVGIKGSSEVRSGHSITLKAEVTNATDTSVKWEIVEGSEYASISDNGVLEAKTTQSEREIIVRAYSNENNEYYGEKIITVVCKPELTQAMLDELNADKISFEGYVNISLYTIEGFSKLYRTFTSQIKTSMDGTNWYAEYENADTGIKQGLYYKNNNGIASQVGVSFMNEEQYYPLLDDFGNETSWHDSGLYNGLKNLSIDDFAFDEETWRYKYVGNDETLDNRILAAANPYDFIVDGFYLIIEEGEIMGIYAKSLDDYTIVQNYRAIQELFVAFDKGNQVKVPTISKYSHEDIHDDLQVAINNMRNLSSYKLNFREITASYLTSGYATSGYTEYITSDIAHFEPYTTSYDVYGKGVDKYTPNSSYGYKKVNDGLYNTYTEDEDGTFEAVRAYNKDFSHATPSFAFAPELFRTYYIDDEKGTTTYYVDSVMSGVASTFYYGVGNDINLYGIFATTGQISATESFTPYVVVKDGYITNACFYFYIGSIFGVVELEYSEFNNVTNENIEKNVEFTTRAVPQSWSEINITVSAETGSTKDDYEVNALTYLQQYFEDDQIESKMPFFGTPLGDTYGFGLTTIYMANSDKKGHRGIVFYYDVPLDINYTIESSLKAISDYLISLGFEKNRYDEYTKGDIVIAPVDSGLDLMIYVWKATN